MGRTLISMEQSRNAHRILVAKLDGKRKLRRRKEEDKKNGRGREEEEEEDKKKNP